MQPKYGKKILLPIKYGMKSFPCKVDVQKPKVLDQPYDMHYLSPPEKESVFSYAKGFIWRDTYLHNWIEFNIWIIKHRGKLPLVFLYVIIMQHAQITSLISKCQLFIHKASQWCGKKIKQKNYAIHNKCSIHFAHIIACVATF